MCGKRGTSGGSVDSAGWESAHGSDVYFCAKGMERYREALNDGVVSQEVPECLVAYGLLRPMPGLEGFHVPVPPAVAETELSRSIVRDMELGERKLSDLKASFAAAVGVYSRVQQDSSGYIESLRGADVISQSLGLVVGSCREELLTAQPGGGRSPDLLAEALPRDRALLEQGMAQRTLYQHSVRSHQATLSYIEQVSGAGAEVRTLDEVFERIIVCDRKVAFIPGSSDRRSAALAVRHPGVVAFLVKVFEHMWDRADPVSLVPEQYRPDLLTDQVRATMLRLVVSGHTDDSIAGRLGVSSRTVSSHIKKVADALGSRSRAELGYLISERGLLHQASVGF